VERMALILTQIRGSEEGALHLTNIKWIADLGIDIKNELAIVFFDILPLTCLWQDQNYENECENFETVMLLYCLRSY
jgi:hypothetical protein